MGTRRRDVGLDNELDTELDFNARCHASVTLSRLFPRSNKRAAPFWRRGCSSVLPNNHDQVFDKTQQWKTVRPQQHHQRRRWKRLCLRLCWRRRRRRCILSFSLPCEVSASELPSFLHARRSSCSLQPRRRRSRPFCGASNVDLPVHSRGALIPLPLAKVGPSVHLVWPSSVQPRNPKPASASPCIMLFSSL